MIFWFQEYSEESIETTTNFIPIEPDLEVDETVPESEFDPEILPEVVLLNKEEGNFEYFSNPKKVGLMKQIHFPEAQNDSPQLLGADGHDLFDVRILLNFLFYL